MSHAHLISLLLLCIACISVQGQNSSQELHLNEWVEGRVSDLLFEFYFLNVSAHASSCLTVEVSPVQDSSSNPDLYISPSTFPSLTHNRWRSAYPGNDTIAFDLFPLDPSELGLYIGVYGQRGGSYSIRASIANSCVDDTDLTDALPVYASVETDQYVSYSFEYKNASGFSVYLDMLSSGDADLFIAERYTPTSSNFDWSSTESGNDKVTVKPIFYEGPIYVSVYGKTSAAYKLVASLSHASPNITEMHDGQQLSAYVEEVAFFSFQITLGAGFSLNMNTEQSQTALCVADAPCTNLGDCKWFVYGSDAINVKSTKYEVLYVSVAAFSTSQVQLSLQLTKKLDVEQRRDGNVTVSSYNYYKLRVSGHYARHLTIQVSPDTSGNSNPDLYVSTTSLPTLVKNQWKSANPVGNDTVVIDLSGFNTNETVFYIGVYGTLGGGYSIEAGVDTTPASLPSISSVSSPGQDLPTGSSGMIVMAIVIAILSVVSAIFVAAYIFSVRKRNSSTSEALLH